MPHPPHRLQGPAPGRLPHGTAEDQRRQDPASPVARREGLGVSGDERDKGLPRTWCNAQARPQGRRAHRRRTRRRVRP
ncbi:MAG: hypothetical protein NTV11_01200 [Rhodocyclales bacterium]|nr:hypothetical protein [Rhodocyclales bacterium]